MSRNKMDIAKKIEYNTMYGKFGEKGVMPNSDLMSGWFFRLINGHGVTLFRSARTYQSMEYAGWLAYETWKRMFWVYPEAVLEVDYTKDYLAEQLDVLKRSGVLV